MTENSNQDNQENSTENNTNAETAFDTSDAQNEEQKSGAAPDIEKLVFETMQRKAEGIEAHYKKIEEATEEINKLKSQYQHCVIDPNSKDFDAEDGEYKEYAAKLALIEEEYKDILESQFVVSNVAKFWFTRLTDIDKDERDVKARRAVEQGVWTFDKYAKYMSGYRMEGGNTHDTLDYNGHKQLISYVMRNLYNVFQGIPVVQAEAYHLAPVLQTLKNLQHEMELYQGHKENFGENEEAQKKGSAELIFHWAQLKRAVATSNPQTAKIDELNVQNALDTAGQRGWEYLTAKNEKREKLEALSAKYTEEALQDEKKAAKYAKELQKITKQYDEQLKAIENVNLDMYKRYDEIETYLVSLEKTEQQLTNLLSAKRTKCINAFFTPFLDILKFEEVWSASQENGTIDFRSALQNAISNLYCKICGYVDYLGNSVHGIVDFYSAMPVGSEGYYTPEEVAIIKNDFVFIFKSILVEIDSLPDQAYELYQLLPYSDAAMRNELADFKYEQLLINARHDSNFAHIAKIEETKLCYMNNVGRILGKIIALLPELQNSKEDVYNFFESHDFMDAFIKNDKERQRFWLNKSEEGAKLKASKVSDAYHGYKNLLILDGLEEYIRQGILPSDATPEDYLTKKEEERQQREQLLFETKLVSAQ